MTCLPDANLWIALTVGQHVLHTPAKYWFESAANDTIAFCRVTQMGFLRLLTNPLVMQGDALTAIQSWRVLRQLRANDQVIFAPEPSELDPAWQRMTAAHTTGANFWTDTYLAAFAETAGYTLVTFDRDFRKHKDLLVKFLGN